MMMSARFAGRLPSFCKATHRKKHSARSSISALIHRRSLAQQPAAMQYQQEADTHKKIPERYITCSREPERFLRLILQRLLRSRSRRDNRQHQLSRRSVQLLQRRSLDKIKLRRSSVRQRHRQVNRLRCHRQRSRHRLLQLSSQQLQPCKTWAEISILPHRRHSCIRQAQLSTRQAQDSSRRHNHSGNLHRQPRVLVLST